MKSSSDLNIRSLGPCRFDSPLAHLLARRRRTIEKVEETDRVLFDDTRSAALAHQCGVEELPAGCTDYVLEGVNYKNCGGIYYEPDGLSWKVVHL